MNLSLIAAIAKNYVEGRGYPIGKDGKLPWNIEEFEKLHENSQTPQKSALNPVVKKDHSKPFIPEDLKRFRELTLNHPVIMGRKTYESIGKPLRDRLNIVITRNLEYKSEGVKVFHTLEAALSCLECGFVKQEGINCDLTYIIGGESIFNKALPIADKLEITHVDQIVENADAFFPKIEGWKEVKREDNKGYSFVSYER